MSFNLPAARILNLSKGAWAQVAYPASVVVRVELTPRDYFGPVKPDAIRSCVPAGGTGFSSFLDANSGRLVLRGSTMLPSIATRFDINGGKSLIEFADNVMTVSNSVAQESDLDALLTSCEHTIPSLLSLTTGLSVYAESVQILVADSLEARSETFLPPNSVRIVDSAKRSNELESGLRLLWSTALPSDRYILAISYLREAIFFDAPYNEHNPYLHSLLVILKCAQSIEVLFGTKRDVIRVRCKELGIDETMVETHIIPITLTRNELGSAHASAFVPTPQQATTLRAFAKRSVETIRSLLLHIAAATPDQTAFLMGHVVRNSEKDALFTSLERSLSADPWTFGSKGEIRTVLIKDPRLTA